ncbi:hypothetical protein BHM03_00024730 [Ensete ventricosum]|nr:hypothetical protein BHM03_00024730 [Ensete ventricosum]
MIGGASPCLEAQAARGGEGGCRLPAGPARACVEGAVDGASPCMEGRRRPGVGFPNVLSSWYTQQSRKEKVIVVECRGHDCARFQNVDHAHG